MFRCARLILPVALGAQQSAPSDVMSAMHSGTAIDDGSRSTTIRFEKETFRYRKSISEVIN